MKLTFASPSKNSVRKEEKTNGNCKLFCVICKHKKDKKGYCKAFLRDTQEQIGETFRSK